MNAIKANNIPTWVTIIAIILGLFCLAGGIMGLLDPTSVTDYAAGANNLASAWAGRMAGTGAALLVAVWLKNAGAYAAAFAASIFRELGDLVAAMSGTAEGFPLLVVAIVLIIDLVAFVIAIQAVRKA